MINDFFFSVRYWQPIFIMNRIIYEWYIFFILEKSIENRINFLQ